MAPRNLRRAGRSVVLTMAAAITATTVVGAVAAAPAHADTAYLCSYVQNKSFPTPGKDTKLQVDVCYSGVDTWRSAQILVLWDNGGDSAADGNRKFDKLRLNVRLERYDKVKFTASCSIAGQVNRHRSGHAICDTSSYNSSAHWGWTGDGTVTYDIDRDGKGSKTWSLKGSPQSY